MKKYLLFAYALLFILMSSCQKLDELTQFEMDYQETVIIPASVEANIPYEIQTPEITTNAESEFEVHDTRKENIEEIKLNELKLSLIDPDDGNFDFLNEISVYLSTEQLPEIKVAWKEDIPENALQALQLNTSDENIGEYIKQESFRLRIETTTDKVITRDHEIQLDAVFLVNAKLIK
ncbi:MAG: hypothetical protein ACQES0_01215 [Bacteroidota bacterium]